MSRNGSGTYSLPVNSWNPAVNGVPATASDWQALINDVASAITQSVSRDGQTTMTGNLPMGGNKLTGMAAGTAAGDSLRFEQLFSQGQPLDLASAATTDIGAQLTTVLNITGTTTITSFGTNYNGPRFLRFAGALTLTHGAALVLPGAANITTAAGDAAIVVPLGTPASGWRVAVYQRASGEALVATSPATYPAAQLTGTVAIANGGTGQTTAAGAFGALKQDATETATGVVELATTAEAQAGTDAVRALTPARLKDAQIQRGTAVTLTTQTAVDFTGIPSWVNRVNVLFSGVSTNGTSPVTVRLGTSGGIEATGYSGSGDVFSTAPSPANFTTGFQCSDVTSGSLLMSGLMSIGRITGNSFVMSFIGAADSGGGNLFFSAGSKTLGGLLDRLRITTAGGTDTFDAGTINISWE